MDDHSLPFDPPAPYFRIEHRAPDGAGRVLAITTLPSSAHTAAATWRRTLRRRGAGGAVVVVDERWERVIRTEPLDPA